MEIIEFNYSENKFSKLKTLLNSEIGKSLGAKFVQTNPDFIHFNINNKKTKFITSGFRHMEDTFRCATESVSILIINRIEIDGVNLSYEQKKFIYEVVKLLRGNHKCVKNN